MVLLKKIKEKKLNQSILGCHQFQWCGSEQPHWDCKSITEDKGKSYPCFNLVQQWRTTCVGSSAGMPACLFQHRLGLHCLFLFPSTYFTSSFPFLLSCFFFLFFFLPLLSGFPLYTHLAPVPCWQSLINAKCLALPAWDYCQLFD